MATKPTISLEPKSRKVKAGGSVVFRAQVTGLASGEKHHLCAVWDTHGAGKFEPDTKDSDLFTFEVEGIEKVASLHRAFDKGFVTVRWQTTDVQPGSYTISVDVHRLPEGFDRRLVAAGDFGKITGLTTLGETQTSTIDVLSAVEEVGPPPPSPAPEPAAPAADRAATEAARAAAELLRAAGESPAAVALQRAAETARAEIARLAAGGVPVSLRRTETPATDDQALWTVIRASARALSWDNYSESMSRILCGEGSLLEEEKNKKTRISGRLKLPFPDVDAYRQLKVATEVFMMVNCGVQLDETLTFPVLPKAIRHTAEEEHRLEAEEARVMDEEKHRYNRYVDAGFIQRLWRELLSETHVTKEPEVEHMAGTTISTLPYLALIRRKLKDVAIVDPRPGEDHAAARCYGILMDKLTHPCLLELIWSYWHEEGMLVQAMNAISWRFQNQRGPSDRDPLALLEIDPLRPLNNFIWGYIQDEQHRLTVPRRAFEYDHHYGLKLIGKAVPAVRGADSRARFIEAFHNLLYVCGLFFKEDDDTTVVADGFPVLNALREVHLLLTQGAHNQYGDLPWTARHEMLMQQWMLARPEMREFLPSRIMVDYPEEWMDRVETMKTLQGWTDASILHFRDLGVFGEQILLGVRFGAWPSIIEPARAANWARYWRAEIQGYVHAYRAVTGADLTDRADATLPAALLQRRAIPRTVPVRVVR